VAAPFFDLPFLLSKYFCLYFFQKSEFVFLRSRGSEFDVIGKKKKLIHLCSKKSIDLDVSLNLRRPQCQIHATTRKSSTVAVGDPHTNASQFQIVLEKFSFLDGLHVVFGQVVEGLDVLRSIEDEVGTLNRIPSKPVVIADCGEL
jgi:cyclophilin family peptidyl-prolyl cis-trans isomerase